MSATKIPSALDRLEGVITRISRLGYDEIAMSSASLRDLAVELSHVYHEFDDNYVRLDAEGEVPTVAQGVALARFLRPHFNSDKSHWGAFVSRSGAGLGSNYLHVRFNDGYEGGIAKDGSTST